MLARGEVIEKIGGFGESFLHCGEDVDLCFRVRQEGWDIGYLSEAVVIHYASQSSRQAPVRTVVNSALSIQEYFNRCIGNTQGLFYKLIIRTLRIPLMVTIGIAKVMFGFESIAKFRERLQIARGLWLWRVQQK